MATTYSELELAEAVEKSDSLAEVLRNLGLAASGTAYKNLRANIYDYNISILHFGTRPRNMDTMVKPVEYFLKLNGPKIRSSRLKEKLWESGLLEEKCYRCGITEWQSEEAPLDLEHINGNHQDNRIENLTILCANCHRLTETWGFKRGYGREKNKCLCGREISKRATSCRSCVSISVVSKPKIQWPSDEKLLDMLAQSNYRSR